MHLQYMGQVYLVWSKTPLEPRGGVKCCPTTLCTSHFTEPSPSDTWSSQGWGMVGRLSLVSMTITVRVAEPTRAGLPLSVAISTSLDTEHNQGWGLGIRENPGQG